MTKSSHLQYFRESGGSEGARASREREREGGGEQQAGERTGQKKDSTSTGRTGWSVLCRELRSYLCRKKPPADHFLDDLSTIFCTRVAFEVGSIGFFLVVVFSW